MTDYYRKLQIVGNRSYAVSLPKKWIINNNLEKNKEIQITEKDNDLIISPIRTIKESDTKNILIEDLQLIPSIILLSYTKGVDKLILNYKNKDDYLSAKPLVLEMLSHLEGYKITNEINNQILITDSYKESNNSINEIVKRMIIILNNMVDCILQGKNKTKEILERESDSLYHFSKRTLYLCSIDQSIKKDNEIKDIEEIFLWRLIFKKLENIGDILKKINKKSIQKEDLHSLITILNDYFILNKTIKIQNILEIKKKGYNNSNINKVKELVIDVSNNFLLIELNKKF